MTIIITEKTAKAIIKLSIVHSIENAVAETYEPKYNPIIKIYKAARTNIVTRTKCLPLPTHITLKRLA